ncbi:holo-ACP synthase [Sulfurospirillum arcachonense]|uniref:holo-ACP synthase n=1 Tax=Sulfurospirillum arcachonense TaxID=57666 RepID=UPI0004AD3DF2|nr:holo-ACP synthase [Sulfurospirillum arcachonense]
MIGIDIVKIDRIKKFQERFGNKALKKFLDSDEIELARSTNSQAGFWAAKEAVSKALGLGISEKCGFFDIKIHKDEKKAPYFTLSKHLIEDFQITDTALSITHDGGYAIAVANINSKLKRKNPLMHTI